MSIPASMPRRDEIVCTDVNTEGVFETMTFGDAQRAASVYGEPQLYEEGYSYSPRGLQDVYGYVRTASGFQNRRLRGPIMFRRGACPSRLPSFDIGLASTLPPIDPLPIDPLPTTPPPMPRVEPPLEIQIPRKRIDYAKWLPAVAVGAGVAAPLLSVAKARKLLG